MAEVNKVGVISESLEDYLETIYLLIQKQRFARMKDIADDRNVSMASVNSAMKRLAKEGLVEHASRGIVLLTNEGENLARMVLRRHEFVRDFLVSVLRVPEAIAEKDACSFEHFMSPETFHRMVTFFEFITTCGMDIQTHFDDYRKHYDNLEARDNPCNHMHCRNRFGAHWAHARRLTDLKPGESGIVGRIRASHRIRQRLIDMGVLPHVEVTLLRVAPLGDPIEIKLRGYNLSLRKDEASAILLHDDTPESPETDTESAHE
ncbi:DtxR family transcriptional regulator [bacterium]|nr:DtxR family transcriptional regulator [candidate division CSSED10-310 bacterium]